MKGCGGFSPVFISHLFNSSLPIYLPFSISCDSQMWEKGVGGVMQFESNELLSDCLDMMETELYNSISVTHNPNIMGSRKRVFGLVF